MKKSKFSESQIVNILKEAEAGIAVEDLSRQHGFSNRKVHRLDLLIGMVLLEDRMGYTADSARDPDELFLCEAT